MLLGQGYNEFCGFPGPEVLKKCPVAVKMLVYSYWVVCCVSRLFNLTVLSSYPQCRQLALFGKYFSWFRSNRCSICNVPVKTLRLQALLNFYRKDENFQGKAKGGEKICKIVYRNFATFASWNLSLKLNKCRDSQG